MSGRDDGLAEVDRSLAVAGDLLGEVVGRARVLTAGGRHIDDHQVMADQLAGLETEWQAARCLMDGARQLAAAGRPDPVASGAARVWGADVTSRTVVAIEGAASACGLPLSAAGRALGGDVRASMGPYVAPARVRELGRLAVTAGGARWMVDEATAMTREAVRAFAETEVAPLAEALHRESALVPEHLIDRMAEQGFFASSIPEEYGGAGLGHLAMVVTTEELSAVSLAGAGSLITRPEILARALLHGGTADQCRAWLPRIAAGELMVAVAVTEPDAGSDVAALTCRAEPASVGGVDGFVITGPKAWCTFAGRADVVALLARTDPRPSSGARGLSLFIVEKAPHRGRAFEQCQPHGGRLAGRAIPTPGYRGLHSFLLDFDRYFVPRANLVGGDAGLNRGFQLQMAGFAAGRLQTAARAVGVARAALASAVRYVSGRSQFGRTLADYPLTEYRLGWMLARLEAGRRFTYDVAGRMEREEDLVVEPAMAKLLTGDLAVAITQDALLLHGGWGYAEEADVCRYVADALVLPLFEGVRPILALKVIARALLAPRGPAPQTGGAT